MPHSRRATRAPGCVLVCLLALLAGCAGPDKAATEVASAVQAQTSKLSTDDATFLNEAAEAGIAQVTLGQLARAQGSRAAVRDYGLRMTTDFTTLNQQINRLGAAKQISPITTVDAQHQAVYDRLAALRGRAFDRAYLDQMVADQTALLALFRGAAGRAADPDIKAFADGAVPLLNQHLEIAHRLGGHEP